VIPSVKMSKTHRLGVFVVLSGLLVALSPTHAQPASTDQVDFKAVSANVKEPGVPVRIRITRWSTDEERTPIVAALTPAPPPAATPPPAPAGEAGTADRGAAPAARGGAAGRGAGGRGAAGRAGGTGRGGRGGAPAVRLTPIEALTAAIGRAPTIGYIWTNEVTGYAIKYAFRTPLPDGGERIVLATNRRLGGDTPGWKLPGKGPLTDYDFTVLEMHVDAKGAGEAKTSLTSKVVVDPEAGTLALDDYAAAPALLQNIKR
jgi:hypothetical protein